MNGQKVCDFRTVQPGVNHPRSPNQGTINAAVSKVSTVLLGYHRMFENRKEFGCQKQKPNQNKLGKIAQKLLGEEITQDL